MARKLDTERDHNPQADVEEMIAVIADHLGPSFDNGLAVKAAATLARIRAKRGNRS